MQDLLESSLKDRLDLRFLKTNVRKSNAAKGSWGWSLVFAFFSFIARLTWTLLRSRPQIVYYPVTATKVGWLGRDVWAIALSRISGARVVIHLRAGHFRLNYNDFTRLQKAIVRGACGLVSVALVQAECLRNQFEGLIPADRIKILPNALNTHDFQPRAPESADPPLVLFLGFLTFAKGYCDLLRAIPRVAQHIPDVEFAFCGESFTTERNVFHNQVSGERLKSEDPKGVFREVIEGRFEGNVRYPGVVSGNKKRALLNSCSVFCLPSYSEGFSRSILEAMSMGKPVICTPVGALAEVVEDGVNGFIISPGDVDALAQSILRLLRDFQTAEEMGRRNREYARGRFDTEVIAQQLEAYLQQALREA
jgi:glycosyltransferase involved in cell wall biosynthesis